LLYLAVAILAVMAGSRFFKHYMIILAAPLALCAACFFGRLEQLLSPRRWRLAVYALVLALLIISSRTELRLSALTIQATFRGERPASFNLIGHFHEDMINLENRAKDEVLQHIGRHIVLNSRPDEGLYVWPYYPQIYFWAQRYAPTKHYMYFDVIANLPYKWGGWHATVDDQVRRNRRQLLADLEAAPPRFVVFPEENCGPFCPFAELKTWVDHHYQLVDPSPTEKLRLFQLTEIPQ
ncbi:MAG: hypothetical protein ACTSXZ_00995, partial [Alphaproteobacteria bacterium]